VSQAWVHREPIEAMEAVAIAWNRAEVQYAVLRGLEQYPHRLSRVLVCFLLPAQLGQACSSAVSALAQRNWRVVIRRKLGRKTLIGLAASGTTTVSCEIEFVTGIHWGPSRLASRPRPSARIGPFAVDPWAAFAQRILIPFLGGTIEGYPDQPYELDVSNAELTAVVEELPRLAGATSTMQLLRILPNPSTSDMEGVAPTLRRSLIVHSLRNPAGILKASGRRALREARVLFAPRRVPILALVGPDAMEKQSLIRTLQETLPDPLRTVSIPACHDRTALDMAVDPVQYGLRFTWGKRMFGKLAPAPDRTILLLNAPDRVALRKDDLTEAEITEQLRIWLSLGQSGDLDHVVRVNAPPDQLSRRVEALLLSSFLERSGGDLAQQERDREQLDALTSALGIRQPSRSRSSGLTIAALSSSRASPAQRLAPVPSRHAPKLLIPLEEPSAAVAALRGYHPARRLGRISKRLLAFGLRTGLAKPFLRRRTVVMGPSAPGEDEDSSSLREHVGGMFGRKHVLVSISLGAPSPDRKPLIQAMTAAGEILGYVKVGWNERTIPLVQREETVLRQLEGSRFSTAQVPRVLHTGWWSGCYLLAQSPPDNDWNAGPGRPDARHLAFLHELLRLQGDGRTASIQSWMQPLLDRADTLKGRGLSYYSDQIEWALDTCLQLAPEDEFPVGRCHRDFTPWNTLEADGKLFVFDWEYSSQLGTPGWDLFHFLIQSAVLVRRRAGHQIFSDLMSGELRSIGERYLSLMGLSPAAYEVLLSLYVADISSWYLARESAITDGRVSDLMRAWDQIQFLFCADRMQASWSD